MKTNVLISCASAKLPRRSKAADLYISALFQKSLAYAHRLVPGAVFILSAKYGLVPEQQLIDPYDLTLNKMPAAEVKAWAERVFGQLRERTDVDHDHFVFLAGEKYRRFLAPRLHSVDVPMEGLRIGEQLHFLTTGLH